jgi:hypothetical protein
MKESTQKLLKKFEQDYEIYVDAQDALTYWLVYARVQKGPGGDVHHLHHGKKYVSGPNMEGSVLVLSDPFVSDSYSVESWGPMATFDEFVKKALASILAGKNAADAGQENGCGSSCG